jgi:predicted dehydrogenase
MLFYYAWAVSFETVSSYSTYSANFAVFFNSIDKGREMPLTSLADALKTHELIFAADKSASLNTTKKLVLS